MDNVSRENEVQANKLVRIFIYCNIGISIFNLISMALRFRIQSYLDVVAIHCIHNIICYTIALVIDYMLPEHRFQQKKYVLIAAVMLGIFETCRVYIYMIHLLCLVPLFLSARYYDRTFHNRITWSTVFIVIMVWGNGILNGTSVDLNYIEFEPGTLLHITTGWAEDAVLRLHIPYLEQIRMYLFGPLIPMLLYIMMVHIAALGIIKSSSHMMDEEEKLISYNKEFSIASRIQHSMLPTNFLTFNGHKYVNIYAKYYSAKQVGGDLYNFFPIDEHHICLIVGDVSGKGVSAALFMVKCLTYLKSYVKTSSDVAEVMTLANQSICDGNDDLFFATLWLGILDTRTGDLDYVSGGHNRPIFFQKNGSCDYLKGHSNFLVGLMPEAEYQADHLKLELGDRLFLYTDGVTECMNTDLEQYGEDRLKEFFEKRPSNSNSELLDILREDLHIFAGKETQSDDITMMIVSMKAYEKDTSPTAVSYGISSY